MPPEMLAGSLEPMRPDPCVRGPVPSSSRTCSALLLGPPLPSARATWISKSLGQPTDPITFEHSDASRGLGARDLDDPVRAASAPHAKRRGGDARLRAAFW